MSGREHMVEPEVGLGSRLARHLKPVAIGIALVISFVFPGSYFIREYVNLRNTAAVYAAGFAEQLKRVILADQDLWHYQTYRYLQLLKDFPTESELMRVRVLDENGRPINAYEHVNSRLANRFELESAPGRAPVLFNNRTVGTIEMTLPLTPLLKVTAVLFLVSSCVGTGLAFLVYLFPVRVVKKMESDIEGLISSVREARNESDRLRVVAQSSEQRFRDFVQGLNAIVWEADAATWRFLFVSHEAEAILGYAVARWIAEPRFPVNHIHPDDYERVLTCYQIAIQEESGFQLEYRLIASDGREVWIQDFVRLSRNGNLRLMSGVMVDVSERKRAEQVLAEQARELARSNAELEQFAYVASHDLQEPLRMVSNYMQLIERRYQNWLDKDGKEFIAFAVEGATRMQRLIRDLLAYSRLDTRGPFLVAIDTREALEQALDNLKLAITESGAVVSSIPLPTVMADRTQLTQVFQNLIGNAIKFKGDKPLEIQIGVKLVGEEWRFWVRDNGLGIAPEYFDRIFLIFQRLHDRAAYTGTGIGLAICKKIIERHGGRIWVESAPGCGASFYFSIPLKGQRA